MRDTPSVIFENARFLLVDKPEGWLSVPSRTGDADARACAGRWLERERGARLFPCHRLDEPVSGLLLFALDADAHRAANGWFEHGSVRKTYEALSEEPRAGHVPVGFDAPLPLPLAGREVTWESVLAKGKKRAFVNAAQGKRCVTRATLHSVDGGVLRWSLKPLTGRPHQLRFELYQRGSPILGDALYGAQKPWTQTGIALRVFELDFAECAGAVSLGLPAHVRVAGLDRPW